MEMLAGVAKTMLLAAIAAVWTAGCALADTDGWLVVNEDNDHFFKLGDEWQTREGLERYLDIVLKGPVTHFFMCVNGQRTSYGSKTWVPGLGRSPGGGHGNPLQHLCLKNPMDRRAWQAT